MSQSLRPQPLSARAPLLGFRSPLQRSGRRESTARRLPGRAPRFPGIVPVGPTPPATVPLTGFPNLSAAFFLPPPSYPFQAGGAPGVQPYRGLFLPRSPDGSSPPACPLGVPPFGWPPPVLGGGTSGRAGLRLGFQTCAFDRLQGFCPRGSRSVLATHDKHPANRPAPPGLSPPHGLHPSKRAGLPPRYPSRFTSLGSVAGSPRRCAPRLAAHRSEPSFARGLSHHEVSRLRCLSRFGGARRGPIRLSPIHLCPSTPLTELHEHPCVAALKERFRLSATC
jgi:hypothetical protein